MSVFVDTSGLLAVVDMDDASHEAASRAWERLILAGEVLVCSNYVLVETFALVQRRFGIGAVRAFEADVSPMLDIEWVDEFVHRAGVAAVLAASRRRLSLVDCVSFELMRRLGIRQVFCFDPHFEEHGFQPVDP